MFGDQLEQNSEQVQKRIHLLKDFWRNYLKNSFTVKLIRIYKSIVPEFDIEMKRISNCSLGLE